MVSLIWKFYHPTFPFYFILLKNVWILVICWIMLRIQKRIKWSLNCKIKYCKINVHKCIHLPYNLVNVIWDFWVSCYRNDSVGAIDSIQGHQKRAGICTENSNPLFVLWILITFDKIINKNNFPLPQRNKILFCVFTNNNYQAAHSSHNSCGLWPWIW